MGKASDRFHTQYSQLSQLLFVHRRDLRYVIGGSKTSKPDTQHSAFGNHKFVNGYVLLGPYCKFTTHHFSSTY